MSTWRATWIMFLALHFIKALPRDEAGKRLGLAISDYLAYTLAKMKSPKAQKAAASYAALSESIRGGS